MKKLLILAGGNVAEINKAKTLVLLGLLLGVLLVSKFPQWQVSAGGSCLCGARGRTGSCSAAGSCSCGTESVHTNNCCADNGYNCTNCCGSCFDNDYCVGSDYCSCIGKCGGASAGPGCGIRCNGSCPSGQVCNRQRCEVTVPSPTPAPRNTPPPTQDCVPGTSPDICLDNGTGQLYYCSSGAGGKYIYAHACLNGCNADNTECAPSTGPYCLSGQCNCGPNNTSSMVICYSGPQGGQGDHETSRACTPNVNCNSNCVALWEKCGGEAVCSPPLVSHIDSCSGIDCAAPCVAPTPGNPTAPPTCNPLCPCAASTCVGSQCNSSNCAGVKCNGMMIPTNPGAPVLVDPTAGEIVDGGAIVLDWNVPASWGLCSGTHTYNLCIGTSANAANPCVGVGSTNLPILSVTTTSRTYTQNKAGVYYWKVGANNGGMGTTTVFSAARYFRVNSVPTLTSLTLKNADAVTVPAETGSRNHICQRAFTGSSDPRRVIVDTVLSDADGGANIQAADLRWHGLIYPMILGTVAGNNRNASAVMDLGTSGNSNGLYPFEVRMSDVYVTTAWIDSGRDGKVWDCQVPVSGTIYDGSAGQACNNTGFTVTAGGLLNFQSLIFTNMSGGSDVTMNVSTPESYGSNNMEWGQSYLPIFNNGTQGNPDGNINGGGRFTRTIDLGMGTTYCPGTTQIGISNVVSAYSTNESAKIDFSFIRDQENWFQVSGGGVKARSSISSGVPVTASSTLTVGNPVGASNNGVVASVTFTNTNGNNSASQYGDPNNWRIARDIVGDGVYDYQYLYGQYFEKLGEGVTNTTIAGAGSTGVVFIDGNLNITSNVVVPVGKFLMVVASGSITIGQAVTQVDGIYAADGGIIIDGNSNTQLVINGILYSSGTGKDVRINRSFSVKQTNNTTPAVVVMFRPDFIFNMPGKLTKLLSGWREY